MANEADSPSALESPQPARRTLALRGIARVVFPWAAIGQTYRLAKEEVSRTRANAALLRDLAQDIREAARAEAAASAPELGFEEAIALRNADAATEPELYDYFLMRKRVGLAMAAMLGPVGGIGVIVSLLRNSTVMDNLLSLAGLIAGVGLTLTIAYCAEFRLWQLRTRRLSAAEHGGLADFRATPGWWTGVLNPELGHRTE